MIRKLDNTEFQTIFDIVNDAAEVYRGKIPSDCWREPYMSKEEIAKEIRTGIQFYCYTEKNVIVAVMGIQLIGGITLIRHAYTLASYQRKGIGEKLLKHLINIAQTQRILVGTWETSTWAINFYQKHHFLMLSREETKGLLKKYWDIPELQVETSVVLEQKRCSK